jgi:hypothetical protein
MARRERAREEDARPRDVVAPGVLAGLFAAFVMAVCGLAMAAYEGTNFWGPIALLTTLLPGQYLPEFEVRFLIATLVHLALGAALGVVFTAALPRKVPAAGVLGAGLAYGVVLFVIANYGVLGAALGDRLDTRDYVYWFFVQHAVYGFTLGLVVICWRWAHRPATRPRTA